MQQMKLEADSWEFADAFRGVRFGKNLLWWAVFLAILAQLASAVAVRFAGVLDAQYAKKGASAKPADVPKLETPSQPATGAASRPAAEAGKAPAASSQGKSAEAETTREFVLRWVLRGTKFVGLAAGMLLVLTLMFAVKLALLGRMGGVAGLISAFFWSLILFATLVPWQQVLQSTFACGALFNLADLTFWTGKVHKAWGAAAPRRLETIFYYARFFGYPFVALLLGLIVQAKFARGCRRMGLLSRPGPDQPQAPAQ